MTGVDLRLLTFNLRRDTWSDGANRWWHRRDGVAEVIRRADVAGLQEARWPQLRDTTFGAPGHRWVGVGRNNGRRSGEFVPVLWRAERFRCVDHGNFWLSSTPAVPGSRDHRRAIVRMASWARLVERWTERPLFVLNTHLDHRVEEARVQGARQIRAAVDDLAGDDPVVVTGDLNATPDSEAHAILTAPDGGRVALSDAHDLAPRREGPDTTLNGFDEPRPGKRIDVVLLSPHWRATSYRVNDTTYSDGRFLSDHFPVEVVAHLA